jgi:integrase
MSNEKEKTDRAQALVEVDEIPKEEKYFPAEIVKTMYEQVDNIRDEFYLKWHIETGVRVSDICGKYVRQGAKKGSREIGQEWDRINWDENFILTWDHKKDEWRRVFFTERARAALKKWRREWRNQGYKGRELFPFTSKTCNRIIKKWSKKVGFKYGRKVSTHWCRHTFMRLSRRMGRDPEVLKQNTGDNWETILKWYSGLNAEDMRRELEEKPIL